LVDGTSTIHRFDGSAWSQLETGMTSLQCIFAVAPDDVWLCSDEDIVHYDGQDFVSTELGTSVGTEALKDIWATATDQVWAVGDGLVLAHYDGTTWTGTPVGASYLTSVWASGPTDVFFAGLTEVRRFDGEQSTRFDEVDAGPVFGTGPTDVWVAPDRDELFHWDGSTWEGTRTEFVGSVGAIWGLRPNDLWGTGTAGQIAHWDGAAWTGRRHQAIGAPYLQVFHGVHGSADGAVYFFGEQLGDDGSTPLIYRHSP
jgi:hypothetical protein